MNENAQEHETKAWEIHSYGGIEVLQLNDVRPPTTSKPNEVVIKVHAASLNPIDSLMMGGYARNIANKLRKNVPEFPLVVGREFSGVVLECGAAVDRVKIGDAVYGVLPMQRQGSLAETIVADDTMVFHRPQQLTDVESSSLLYASMTVWSALYLTGKLDKRIPEKQRVLILGASGGTGTVAVQILKSQKVKIVATCSSNAADMVRSLGADKVYDYADSAAMDQLGEEGLFDVVLDCAQFGYENMPGSWKYKRFVTLNSPLMINTDKHGLYLGLALSAGSLLKANVPKLFSSKSVRWGFFKPDKEGLEFIDDLIKTGELKPVVQKVFKFSEVPEAFTALQAGHLRGKIVIDFK